MHHLIFEHSFAELALLILLPGLVLYFLNKKNASVREYAEDADTCTSDSLTALTVTNSGGSSPSPTETNNGVSSLALTEIISSGSTLSPTETYNSGSSLCLTETNNSASSSSPIDTNSGGSSLSPTETNNKRSSSSLTESNSGGSNSSPTESNSGASSSSLTETNYGASSLSLTETISSGCGLSLTESSNAASSSFPTETKTGESSSSPTENNKSASSLSSTETNSSGSSPSPTESSNGASGSSLTDTYNGASNLLTMLTGNCYEVFLSFRGLDTRKGFTDHLYNGLLDAGIDAFRDDEELGQGKNIRPELLAAITNSKILIPILSVNYGTSSWCLDELVQIMECKNNNGQIVLPVFYKVKPSDVGHQIGSFGDAFHEREGRLLKRSSFDPSTLEKWKKALLEVSTLKGYEADGYEAELVKSVVRKALSELKKKFELVISENLVGIDSHVKKVMEFVTNKSHATVFVGIYGMGGIGKTTLAKTIYNKLSNQLEHRSFIADIRESWKRNGIYYLQNQLIYDILKRENEVRNEDEGTKFISSKFKGKKVLILLDDVDNVVQLKRLAGDRDWFSSGSRIIITTRNKRILEEVGVDYPYEHKEMDSNQSLILFSRHAFRRDSPPRVFKDLSHEVVSITGGLPLSLEVFGSLLCGKESTQWRDTIKKLKKVLHMKVQEKLRISYEALDYEQQQIFLDIACFFISTDKRIASYMWDACDLFPGEGIEVLRFMSLVKVGDYHELRMHDQLRDLGREIVRKENPREARYHSRLWDSKEALKVLKENKGTEKIEAIDLSKGSSEGSSKTAKRDSNIHTEKQFKNLTSLRFLHMKGAHLSGDFKDSIEGLRWLRWQKCPMNFKVNNFHVKELVALELSNSEINEKWEGWSSFMMAEKLKFLDLTSCKSLENTRFLSAFKELEVLILNFCLRLKQIDSSIGDMKTLLRLEMRGCDLMELPVEIGKLKALEQLHLEDTPNLSALPESIGSLQNLEILNFSSSGIEELPNSIGRLRKLRHLEASWCRKLGGEMPESIGSLENLETLAISNTSIKKLPYSIGRLRKLRNLDASCCRSLNGEMPESMCNLSSLQRLIFSGCKELQSLPDLPSSLTCLGVTCQSRNLPSLSNLTHLKELRVSDCKFLKCIQELPSTLSKNSECS
ncbi:hypothetical protein BT93_E1493 [Corymbia citriodora subsp. variegata]|nr:hypothetical protein BT93_E1493 [Corymbia citriodora subsp. variegata]